MWHLLGYNLPFTWGNAADWISDAERSGFPLGTIPRVGSLAVFPVADGLWAFGPAGHVAFVTAVSADKSTFDVTYQNYGDPTLMHIGIGYPVAVINKPHYQNGKLRFIYFPGPIDPHLFAQLPGINSNDLAGLASANYQWSLFNRDHARSMDNQLASALSPASSDQEFKADFTGSGLSDLLLYNRGQGSLKVLSLSSQLQALSQAHLSRFAANEILAGQRNTSAPSPQLVTLSDKSTNGWGSSLDIHLGDFTGSGRTDILLYDRVTGKLQLLSLTPQLTIQRHVTLPGWGPGWDVYVGSFDGRRSSVFMYNRLLNALPVSGASQSLGQRTVLQQAPALDNDMSSTLSGFIPSMLTPNVIVLNFDRGFNVRHLQQYTLIDNQWEVYAGGFVNSHQDGLFLYDRTLGEARLLSFDANLQVTHDQSIHSIAANWAVYSGDFMGAGRSQVLLYDPTSGRGEILTLNKDLSPARVMNYTGWGTHQVLYIGHFAAPTLSVMLYDPEKAQSTFLEFDYALAVVHRVTMRSWDRRWQILVGSFLDRSRCIAAHNCAAGDDILVLDRKTGQLEQFAFAFGNRYHVYDNRVQGFMRSQEASTNSQTSVDTSTFSLLTTLNTTIRNEELY